MIGDQFFPSTDPMTSLLLADCTRAVTHAAHSTTLDCLLAGVPMVQLPLHMAQLLVAERLAATGAGLGLLPTHLETGFADVMGEVLRNSRYTETAAAVSARYSNMPRTQALEEMIALIGQALEDGK